MRPRDVRPEDIAEAMGLDLGKTWEFAKHFEVCFKPRRMQCVGKKHRPIDHYIRDRRNFSAAYIGGCRSRGGTIHRPTVVFAAVLLHKCQRASRPAARVDARRFQLLPFNRPRELYLRTLEAWLPLRHCETVNFALYCARPNTTGVTRER